MLIIINATESDELSGDYIDLYNYHILECRSDKFGRFILPGYLPETPTDKYPYDYIWAGYVYKYTFFYNKWKILSIYRIYFRNFKLESFLYS